MREIFPPLSTSLFPLLSFFETLTKRFFFFETPAKKKIPSPHQGEEIFQKGKTLPSFSPPSSLLTQLFLTKFNPYQPTTVFFLQNAVFFFFLGEEPFLKNLTPGPPPLFRIHPQFFFFRKKFFIKLKNVHRIKSFLVRGKERPRPFSFSFFRFWSLFEIFFAPFGVWGLFEQYLLS